MDVVIVACVCWLCVAPGRCCMVSTAPVEVGPRILEEGSLIGSDAVVVVVYHTIEEKKR